MTNLRGLTLAAIFSILFGISQKYRVWALRIVKITGVCPQMLLNLQNFFYSDGHEIVQTFHLCTCDLPNVMEISTRNTFRWQWFKKRSRKLTLNAIIHLSQTASKWPSNCANFPLLCMQSFDYNSSKQQGHVKVANCPKKGRHETYTLILIKRAKRQRFGCKNLRMFFHKTNLPSSKAGLQPAFSAGCV